jgi:hypothetical protein
VVWDLSDAELMYTESDDELPDELVRVLAARGESQDTGAGDFCRFHRVGL